jgi:hypothetical protein
MLPAWTSVVDPKSAPLPADEQLTAVGGWTDTSDVDAAVFADMLDRARQMQSLLTGPFAHMGPWVDARVVLGESQKTPFSVARTGATMDTNDQATEAGDTLVPVGRTVGWGGTSFGQHVTAVDEAREHAFLCEDEAVLGLIKKWIKQAPPAPPT